MRTTINVENNEGIISTGKCSENVLIDQKKECRAADDINWEALNKEIGILESSPDPSIRKFAHEAGEAAEKEDRRGVREVFSKWIPCIADLISSSYYIIEIAKNFGIGFLKK